MDVVFVVHSMVEDDVAMRVPLNGVMTDVKVPGLVVELVGPNESMCHTHRFVPADMDAAKALFAVGAEVVVSFSAA